MAQEKRVALITGSNQGIGLAIADVLARHGSDIVLHGLFPVAEGEQQARALSQRWNVDVHFLNADLANPAEAVGLIDQAVSLHGRLDILVNNAGIQAVNLRAPFLLTQAVLPHMRRANWGRIVNIASVHGLVASVNKAAYCAAKHGLVGLTKVAALETATDGITVNAICPGWTETPILEPQIAARAAQLRCDRETAIRSLVAEKQPNQTLMPSAWIGETVAFLCSDAAAGMTGTALPVDGGWTAQ
jgi:3-hydroxybutyrate dehydrogenase